MFWIYLTIFVALYFGLGTFFACSFLWALDTAGEELSERDQGIADVGAGLLFFLWPFLLTTYAVIRTFVLPAKVARRVIKWAQKKE